MSTPVFTVFGGTGFLGRAIVRRLLSRGAHVRVAVRNPGRAVLPADTEGVWALACDIRDEAAVAAAVDRAAGVVNAVGLYVETGAATFDAVHVQGALHVARQAARAGVGSLVHISGIGADLGSESRYVRARAEGERRVLGASDTATIVRSSVLFGPGDTFLNSLEAISRHSPILPLFGRGATRLQPGYVGDIAEAVARVLEDSEAWDGIYELGGPVVYTYRSLVEMVLKYLRRRRLLLPLPFFIWKLLASLLAGLPNPPLTRDQVVLMQRDNVVEQGAQAFADLHVKPRSLEELLSGCLDHNKGEIAQL